MKVKCTIFKPNGKYYTSGEYETSNQFMFEIFEEVRQLVLDGKTPGIREGAHWSDIGTEDWMVLIDVPDHPHNHPHIVRTIRER